MGRSFPNYLFFPFSSPSPWTRGVGRMILKKSSHIASAVMASNTVASKSMEPVLDFAAVSTLAL